MSDLKSAGSSNVKSFHVSLVDLVERISVCKSFLIVGAFLYAVVAYSKGESGISLLDFRYLVSFFSFLSICFVVIRYFEGKKPIPTDTEIFSFDDSNISVHLIDAEENVADGTEPKS